MNETADPTTWRSETDLDEFYAIRVTTDRPLDDATARQLFGCIGYAFRAHLRGEPLGEPQREAPNRWVAAYDITKSRSDDWGWRLPDALAAARTFAVSGTPPRKTKDNTQLVAGIGPVTLTFEFA